MRMPDLDFKLSHAACGSFNIPLEDDQPAQNIALLCFSSSTGMGSDHPDTCRT